MPRPQFQDRYYFATKLRKPPISRKKKISRKILISVNYRISNLYRLCAVDIIF